MQFIIFTELINILNVYLLMFNMINNDRITRISKCSLEFSTVFKSPENQKFETL